MSPAPFVHASLGEDIEHPFELVLDAIESGFQARYVESWLSPAPFVHAEFAHDIEHPFELVLDAKAAGF